MKKLLLLVCFLAFTIASNAQTLSYSELQQVFNKWMQGKSKTVETVNLQLKAISPKWKMQFHKPMTTTGGEEKYYFWSIVDAKRDTTVLALYIEEDETTVRYALKYAFHDQAVYNSLLQSLKTAPYYNGNITTDTNNSTGESSILAHPSESLPLSKRIDAILTNYSLNVDARNRLYSIEISSRIIPKTTL